MLVRRAVIRPLAAPSGSPTQQASPPSKAPMPPVDRLCLAATTILSPTGMQEDRPAALVQHRPTPTAAQSKQQAAIKTKLPNSVRAVVMKTNELAHFPPDRPLAALIMEQLPPVEDTITARQPLAHTVLVVAAVSAGADTIEIHPTLIRKAIAGNSIPRMVFRIRRKTAAEAPRPGKTIETNRPQINTVVPPTTTVIELTPTATAAIDHLHRATALRTNPEEIPDRPQPAVRISKLRPMPPTIAGHPNPITNSTIEWRIRRRMAAVLSQPCLAHGALAVPAAISSSSSTRTIAAEQTSGFPAATTELHRLSRTTLDTRQPEEHWANTI